MIDPEKITPVESVTENSEEIIINATGASDVAAVADEVKSEVIEEEKNVHQLNKEEILERLKEIVATTNVNAHKEVLALKQALFLLRQREVNEELNAFVEAGNPPESFSATPDEIEAQVKDLIVEFKDMRNEFLEAEERRKAENLEKKREILSQMEAIASDADNVNVQFNRFQELQQEFKTIQDVTASAETEIWREFQRVNELFYDTLKMNKELRDLDFKKNLESKRRLIGRAVALELESDIIEAARKLQQLHAEWREIGPVMKDLRDSIWEEFKEASAVINRKHQEFFDQRKEEETKNEEAKRAICEDIEAIDCQSFSSSAHWEEAANKIKELQAKWRTIGFASKKGNVELYGRFRKACDLFFEAKSAYYKALKDEIQSNLDKKIALCEKAEALADTEDLKKNLDEVVRLQAEWKKIGMVPRKMSDSIWERFSSACNKFFDQRKKELNARHNEQNSNLETKRGIIARLNEIPIDIDRREGLRQVKALQAEWNEIGHVPYRLKEEIYKEYRTVCDRLYEAFAASRQNERRRDFEGQMNKLKGDERKIRTEREKLQRSIELKEQDLKNYRNNLAFFNVKSSAGNSLVKDIERKIVRIEQDIQELREKISMLNEVKED